MIDNGSTSESLYYKAFHSFLLQQPCFKNDFEMFRDQYLQYPKSFQIFKKSDLLRIKQMQDAYKSGKISIFEGFSIENIPVNIPLGEKCDKSHKEICAKFLKDKSLLEPYTGPIDWITDEFPVIYGKIDLMVQSGFNAYIIEVKSEPAEHDIIGQVMKYFIGMSLKLILKHWDQIKILTLAPGYNPDVINSLHQIGATPLLLDPQEIIIKAM